MTGADFINAAQNQPEELREMLKNPAVASALEALGIQLRVFELHAPSESSRVSHGLGPTLCNDRGRRHPTIVTCKKCLNKLT